MNNKASILVLDDNKKWLDTIETILGTTYDLTLVLDHFHALRLLKSSFFDLVILDKQLSGISGLEVLQQMRGIVPELRAIMLTGYADVASAVESMKIGALDYIDKGTRNLTAELRTRVKEALERRKSSSDLISGGSQLGDAEIAQLVSRGESSQLEFKSSARWDFRASRLNKELERIITKTVAGFLNSEGGVLLIGVDDNGTTVGLAEDYKTLGKKPNRDGYENFLTTLLLDTFGKDCSALLRISFHVMEDKDVCKVNVKPAPRPIFIRDEKYEHFYVRTGNSTRLLLTSEVIEYCKVHWNHPLSK